MPILNETESERSIIKEKNSKIDGFEEKIVVAACDSVISNGINLAGLCT